MENLKQIKQSPPQFLSMTSLKLEEFELLHDHFEEHCNNYFYYHTLQGKQKQKIGNLEQKNAKLQGSEMKLFFLLSYLKNYPLQQFHGAYFNITQPKVSSLVKVLLPILQETLLRMGLVPTNSTVKLKTELEKYQLKEANMDATEREVNRSVDYEVQKEFYSGKKKDI
jgi:hypothetical protein